jgi:hypothetical protein
MQFAENTQANCKKGTASSCQCQTPYSLSNPGENRALQWELYSPDLAPSDIHLFGPLKNYLGGRRFIDDKEVEMEVWE